MNNYHKLPEETAGKAQEPLAEYGLSSHRRETVVGISDQLMEELLQQTDEVKLVIINRLTDSMLKKRPEKEASVDLDTWKKAMETKRKEMQQKYNLPDDLAQLLGCIPPISDEEMEEAKVAYLQEKYR